MNANTHGISISFHDNGKPINIEVKDQRPYSSHDGVVITLGNIGNCVKAWLSTANALILSDKLQEVALALGASAADRIDSDDETPLGILLDGGAEVRE